MWKPFLIEKYFSGEVNPSSEDIMAQYDWFKLQYKKGISNMLDYTLAHPNVNASESVRAYKMIEDSKAERKAMPTQGDMLKKITESDPDGLTEKQHAIADAFQAFGQALHKNEFGKQPLAFRTAVKLALENQKNRYFTLPEKMEEYQHRAKVLEEAAEIVEMHRTEVQRKEEEENLEKARIAREQKAEKARKKKRKEMKAQAKAAATPEKRQAQGRLGHNGK